jgi:hypothetical protein
MGSSTTGGEQAQGSAGVVQIEIAERGDGLAAAEAAESAALDRNGAVGCGQSHVNRRLETVLAALELWDDVFDSGDAGFDRDRSGREVSLGRVISVANTGPPCERSRDGTRQCREGIPEAEFSSLRFLEADGQLTRFAGRWLCTQAAEVRGLSPGRCALRTDGATCIDSSSRPCRSASEKRQGLAEQQAAHPRQQEGLKTNRARQRGGPTRPILAPARVQARRGKKLLTKLPRSGSSLACHDLQAAMGTRDEQCTSCTFGRTVSSVVC